MQSDMPDKFRALTKIIEDRISVRAQSTLQRTYLDRDKRHVCTDTPKV